MPKGSRKKVSPAVRDKLLEDCLFRCCLCPDHVTLTLDKHHILPIEEGGPDTEDNLVVVCPNCHRAIHIARKARLQMYTADQIRECKRRWGELCWRKGLSMEQRIEQAPHLRPKVSLSKLPITDPYVVGREEELAVLDAAWADHETRVITIIAFGGIGKSALVNKWLEQMGRDDYRGARRVLGWSFYSQGTHETATSSDTFINQALTFFGHPGPPPTDVWQRVELLTSLIKGQPTLLILDGLEPLQSSASLDEGQVKDTALRYLLRELAREMEGLCVVSSRVQVADLPASEDSGPVRLINLDRLSPAAGRQLLRHFTIEGPNKELEAAVDEYDGHALGLTLLATHLVEFGKRDITYRREITLLDREDHRPGSRQAFRMMNAYDEAFEKAGRQVERAILRLLGLFDRPASAGCVNALRQPPVIAGVTDAVVGLSDKDWQRTVNRLRDLRLLARPEAGLARLEAGKDHGSLDCHPLVRECFGPKLAEESPEGFREAHSRLYDHLCKTAKPLPDTLAEMEPLFQAIHHGCRAGRHLEARRDVYRDRIQRGDEFYSSMKLGAFGSELAGLSGFFARPWSELLPGFSNRERGYLFNQAGFDLRAVGRLREAAEPLEVALVTDKKAEDWANAPRDAANLAELYLASGDLEQGAVSAKEAVTLAERSEDDFVGQSARAYLAAVLHSQGDLLAARVAFEEAERIQLGRQPEYPRLYSLPGAQYCDVLLDLGAAASVHERAGETLSWAEQGGLGLLSLALHHLSLGRACHLLALATGDPAESSRLRAEAKEHLDVALQGLHEAGTQDYLPKGLLARAVFLRDFGPRPDAYRDLREALELSTRIGLRLHETDARLLEGHLALDEDPPQVEAARAALARAQGLVKETGYHLRDADLLILEGRLLARGQEASSCPTDKAAAEAKLHEAIKVAKREDAEGAVYQVAVDQAERYLKEIKS